MKEKLSPRMQRMYEKAKTLPSVLPQERVDRCLDEAWKNYMKGLKAMEGGVEDPGKPPSHEILHRRNII